MSTPWVRRLMKEHEQVLDKSMTDQGIYWWASPTSLTHGKALILCPPETPYEGCFFIFEFHFPTDYPFSPPKVNVLTSDGKTRFHPNLYIDGKVCLSILGTWTGPSWQSTMSLSMILLSLKALFDSNPISHEPGYSSYSLTNPIASSYAKFVQHQIICYTLYELKVNSVSKEFEEILNELKPNLLRTLFTIIQKQTEYAETLFTNIVYSMRGNTRWGQLKQQMLIEYEHLSISN
jgi:ubiquitin-protein ligase